MYMNSRVLKRKQKSLYSLMDDKQIQLKNRALILDGVTTAEELKFSETWALQDDDNDSGSESFGNKSVRSKPFAPCQN